MCQLLVAGTLEDVLDAGKRAALGRLDLRRLAAILPKYRRGPGRALRVPRRTRLGQARRGPRDLWQGLEPRTRRRCGPAARPDAGCAPRGREVGDKASYTGHHGIIKSKQPEVRSAARVPGAAPLCVWLWACAEAAARPRAAGLSEEEGRRPGGKGAARAPGAGLSACTRVYVCDTMV